ncbi:MAG: hypothetical protein K2F63_04845, partial [Muribaculaceae bacterium]|nr:hypothetical protein [Muribaculaceae bacterium]
MSQTRTHSGVLTVGPDYHARGGIASVLEVYSRTIPGFTFLPTNSRRGKVAGYLNLISTMARMPFYRMRGYGILHAHGACGKSFVRKAMVLAWGRALGFRTIFHAHGGGFPAYAAKIGEDRARAVLGKCSAIAVLARSWVPYYRDVMCHSRVVVVENIIDAPARLPERLPSAELRLLFLGKLCRDKGIYDLLEALAAHKDEFAGRVSLRVGGVGETDIFLERVRSL